MDNDRRLMRIPVASFQVFFRVGDVRVDEIGRRYGIDDEMLDTLAKIETLDVDCRHFSTLGFQNAAFFLLSLHLLHGLFQFGHPSFCSQ